MVVKRRNGDLSYGEVGMVLSGSEQRSLGYAALWYSEVVMR